MIDDRGGRRREIRLRDQPALLEKREPFAENARADAGEPAPQIAEALRSEEQLAHDEDRPALADDLRRAGDRTELRIAELRHARSVPKFSTKSN